MKKATRKPTVLRIRTNDRDGKTGGDIFSRAYGKAEAFQPSDRADGSESIADNGYLAQDGLFESAQEKFNRKKQ